VIQQGRGDHDRTAAAVLARDANPQLAHGDGRRQLGEGFLVEPIGALLGFVPGDDMIVRPQASAASEVEATKMMETHDDVGAALTHERDVKIAAKRAIGQQYVAFT
jgi:hypothetical protein